MLKRVRLDYFQSLDQDIYTDIIEESTYVELAHLEQLRLEKEIIGEYLSAHPLDEFVKEWQECIALDHLGDSFHNEVVEVIGILSDVNHRITKTNRPFTMGMLEDFGAKVTVLAFDSPTYRDIRSQLEDDRIVKIQSKSKGKRYRYIDNARGVTPFRKFGSKNMSC